MANTVIALRSSGVASNTPSLGVLANGELSLNFADGILYYKTSSNTLGSIRTTQPAGLTTEVQYNDAGSFGANANFTFNKTLATLNVKNINVSTNLIATTANLTVNSITTGTGVGGIIAGANVIYSNTFVANTGGITTAGNSSLNGIVTVNYINATSTSNVAIEMYGANTKGGTGYFDFLAANNRSTGTTNPNKAFRIDSNGKFQIINSAYTVNIFDLNDSGFLTIPGALATSQYIQFSDGSRQYTANAGSGSLSNTQILAGLQTVSATNNITFDYVAAANNGFGENFKVGDDAWIGDTNLGNTIRIKGQQNSANAYIMFGNNDGKSLGRAGSGALTFDSNTIWHAGNDGTGSGLDADLLDGLDSASFANASFTNSLATFANTITSFARGGTNAASYTTGTFLTSNGTAFVSVANTGTAGTYGNAAYHPVITTDAYGRVSAVTNTLVQIAASQVTSGVLPFAQGGSNNTTYTTGAILTSNGTSFVALANTGTAGTYANASYVPVITTDAYGRVSSVTNTAIAITSTAVTGVMTFAQGGANATSYTTGGLLTSNGTAFVSVANTGTAGTYANAAYVPVITTDAYGRVSAVTNTLVQIAASQITSGVLPFSQGGANNTTYTTGAILTSNGTAFVALSNTGTAGTYANAAYVPVITTDAYGRVSAVTNTAIAIDTAAITSGTLADARLPATGTAGTYANSTHIPVITTDAKGRVTAITNTVIQSSTTSVQGIVQLNDTVTSTLTSVAATANAVNATYNFASTKFNSSGGTISGDTTITGNLIVNGTTTTVNTSTVSTSDSLLKLANNNTAGDSLDIGFYGTYNATGQKYAGLVRQAGSNFFLFKDLTTDPTSNALATGSLTASNTATLRANITGGTVSSLASAIGVADGGTGATTLTAGGILIGSGTSAVTILANTGTAGTYGNAAYHPVITTDTYGRVSAVTNTAIAIDTAAITSGTLADARLPATGTAGTYANASHIPVITTDSKGRVTAVTNTAIVISAAAITSGTLAVAQGGTGVTTSTGTGSVVLNTSPVLTTPNIGVPSFATLTNATGLPVSGITASTSTALGVGSVELGHASDTTLSRSSAGVLAVEGIVVPTVSSTSTLTNKTLTFPVIDNIKMGYSNTATAAGTTTLTSASNYYQRFTGTTTQTVVLPVTSTLVAGVAYEIENASTGNLTVNSSGGNLVVTIIPGVTVQCMCIGTTLTTAADWDAEYNEFATITGTGSVVLSVSPTLTGTPLAPTASSGTNNTQIATTAFATSTASDLAVALAIALG